METKKFCVLDEQNETVGKVESQLLKLFKHSNAAIFIFREII